MNFRALIRIGAGLLLVSLWAGMVCADTTINFAFRNSLDSTTQTGRVVLPSTYDTSASMPVLVWVQGMYTDMQHGQNYIGPLVSRRGWLLVLAQMHGLHSAPSANTNLGAALAQADLVGALDYTLAHYPKADRSRVYLAGISMGGLTGGLTLANYSKRFAAGVLLMGISDLKNWYDQTKVSSPSIATAIANECGGTPAQAPDEYARRSVLAHGAVLARMPIYISHGLQDSLVPLSHADGLVAAIQQYNPAHLEVNHFAGGHEENKVDKNRFLNFLAQYSRSTNAARVESITKYR